MAASLVPWVRWPRRAGMKRHSDCVVRVEFDEALAPSIASLVDLLGELRVVSLPVEGADAVAAAAFSARGFHLYPTWPNTTVFYDPALDCFFKILHRRPTTLRGRAHSLITDRARQIHALSKWLAGRGVPIPRVRAFGTVREGRKPFYALERAHGRSLYDLLVRDRRAIPPELCRKVIEAVAGLHSLGYWLGDAHLSHVFVHDGEVSGFIDIDSIRRNRPPRLDNLARDLGRLNHPGLSLGRTDKDSLLQCYAAWTNLKDERAFRRLVEAHSSRRWRSEHSDPAADTLA